jgi:hypothetical protein
LDGGEYDFDKSGRKQFVSSLSTSEI